MNLRMPTLLQLRHPLIAFVLIALLLAAHRSFAAPPALPAVTTEGTVSISMTSKGFFPNQLVKQAGTSFTLKVSNQDIRPHNFVIEELHIHTSTLMPGEELTLVLPSIVEKGSYLYTSQEADHQHEAGFQGMLMLK